MGANRDERDKMPIGSRSHAIREAPALWEQRAPARAQILASVDAAEAALARGEGREITQESKRNLAAKVKQRGRTRHATEQTPKS